MAHATDYDICECGDYRHDHENHTGGCEICSWHPGNEFAPCDRFRLARSAPTGVQDSAMGEM